MLVAASTCQIYKQQAPEERHVSSKNISIYREQAPEERYVYDDAFIKINLPTDGSG